MSVMDYDNRMGASYVDNRFGNSMADNYRSKTPQKTMGAQ